jgi:glycosyltransferase involved in cell wall biosynthesis
MSKLWIAGICQNNAKELRELLSPISFCFNDECGSIFVDGGSTDDTVATIARDGGIVLQRKWTNDHDFQMNEYMRSGHIQHGDWVLQIDTSERIHPHFIQKLKAILIPNFERQNINTVYQRSKPLLFRYHDDQFYLGSPHWGIQNMRSQVVDISKFDGFQDDKTYIWSTRDDINKWVMNGMKYYLVYGRSNHMWLVYNHANYPGTTEKLIWEHELKRHEFRDYCRKNLKIDISNLDAFTEVLKSGPNADLIGFMNYEKVIANYYRFVVLGEDQKKIYDTQKEWRYS